MQVADQLGNIQLQISKEKTKFKDEFLNPLVGVAVILLAVWLGGGVKFEVAVIMYLLGVTAAGVLYAVGVAVEVKVQFAFVCSVVSHLRWNFTAYEGNCQKSLLVSSAKLAYIEKRLMK